MRAVVIQKKSFYVRRIVDLWIASLTTLQTVQSLAMTVTILQRFHACDTENTQHALNDNISELPQICIANSHNDGLKLSWTVMESNSK